MERHLKMIVCPSNCDKTLFTAVDAKLLMNVYTTKKCVKIL